MSIQRITKIEGEPEKPDRPYSLGTVAEGKFIFLAGCGPFDPKVGGFVRGSIEEQTRLTLETLQRIAKEAGGDLRNAVSCRVFLQQLTETNFAAMNKAFTAFFGEDRPVRTTIGAQLLNIDVEIDAIIKL